MPCDDLPHKLSIFDTISNISSNGWQANPEATLQSVARSALVLHVYLSLLPEVLPVLLLGVLLGILGPNEPAVEVPAVVGADIGVVPLGPPLVEAQELLQKLPLVDELDGEEVLVADLLAGPEEVVEHGRRLFAEEGDRPLEDVEEVGEVVGVLALQVLLDVEGVVLLRTEVTLNFMTAPLLL